MGSRKRQRPEGEADNHVHAAKKSKKQAESKPASVAKTQQVLLHPRTDFVDFHKNIYAFSNMREFMEQVFEGGQRSKQNIVESLVLFLLEVSAFDCLDLPIVMRT